MAREIVNGKSMLTPEELTGKTRTHVIQFESPRFAAHPEAAEAFYDMASAARKDGIELWPFSSFRDFKTQVRIWNHKFSGKKPLYDEQGQVRDFSTLSPEEIVGHILDWSALPGGSRHHWGTEIDVVDKAVMAEGYQPKLLPEETEPGGIFYPLKCWLDAHIHEYGFFRPYQTYQGGMFPEPWHLSYGPVSNELVKLMTVDVLVSAIQDSNLLGKELVMERLPQILEGHVLNISAA